MLAEEWDWETALKVNREEALEEGEAKGQMEVLELVKKGYSYEEILEILGFKAKLC